MTKKDTGWEKDFDKVWNRLKKPLFEDGEWVGMVINPDKAERKLKQFIKKVETDAVRGVVKEVDRILNLDCSANTSIRYLYEMSSKLKSNLKEKDAWSKTTKEGVS